VADNSVDYLIPGVCHAASALARAHVQQPRTISFGPPFGYDLVSRRLRPGEAQRFDLSGWRVAGIGAEMIGAETMERFAGRLAPAGFDPKAFLACYGMAECALAVTFAPLGQGLQVDRVNGAHLATQGAAVQAAANFGQDPGTHVSTYVNCGRPLPNHEVEVRDPDGRRLPDRRCGVIHVRGPRSCKGIWQSDASRRA
jgi:fatty-acyl-CoA synthase